MDTSGLPNRFNLPKAESLILATVLVASFHAIPLWILHLLPARAIYEHLGAKGYATLYDALSMAMPLLLCLCAPIRSGLKPGRWKGQIRTVLAICAVPIVLTAIFYPFTSRPFSGDRIGGWLLSPLAQDLLFAGYLYGLFKTTFSGNILRKPPIDRAILVTAVFFALWHVPNLVAIPASYVAFQLLYTFVGLAWMLIARQLTGSILPVLLTHMVCNFIASL